MQTYNLQILNIFNIFFLSINALKILLTAYLYVMVLLQFLRMKLAL